MVTTIDTQWSELSNKLVNTPDDFNTWESLIALSSQGLSKLSTEEELTRFRITYDSLLFRFPNLEQYWINYALLEFRLGFTDNCLKVFEKSLTTMPCSMKIWVEYLDFLAYKAGYGYELVIKKYQEAELHIGDHYHAFEFWTNYLNYEKLENGRSLYYYNLFKKILELSLYHYAEFFGKWVKELDGMNKENVFKIIKKEELPKKFRITELKESDITEAVITDLKVKIKKIYTDVYITTQYKSHELFKYEGQIKLEYFIPGIFKSYQELDNWGQYLTFISRHPSNLPQQRIVNLFERCLISCAVYPQFWIQYAEYFLKANQPLDAKNTLYRSLAYLNDSNNLPVYNLIIDIELSLKEFYKVSELLVSLLEYRDELNLELYLKFLELQYLFHYNGKAEEFKNYLRDLFNSGSIPLLFQLNILTHLFEYFKENSINNINFLEELNKGGKFDNSFEYHMIKLNLNLFSESVKIPEVIKCFHEVAELFKDDFEVTEKLENWYELYLAYDEDNDLKRLFAIDSERTFKDV